MDKQSSPRQETPGYGMDLIISVSQSYNLPLLLLINYNHYAIFVNKTRLNIAKKYRLSF